MINKEKKEISVIKTIFLILVIFCIVGFGIKFLFFGDFIDLHNMSLSSTYLIVNDYFPEALIICFIYLFADFLGLFFGILFILLKRKFIKNSSYTFVFLFSLCILLISWINDIRIGMSTMYKYGMLFLDLSLFLWIGIFLILVVVFYYIIYKNISNMNKRVIPVLLSVFGIILICVGIYKIRNDLNIEYVQKYLERNNID